MWDRSVDLTTTPGNLLNTTTFNVTYDNALYAGGDFTTAQAALVNRVAKWNGTAWSALDMGLTGGDVTALIMWDGDLIATGSFPLTTGVNNRPLALYVFNGNLIVAGLLTVAGGVAVTRIAEWNDTVWSALPGGPTGAGANVASIGEFTGNLIAGGFFTAPGSNIALWNGAAWSALGVGKNSIVRALAVADNRLVVGGDFTGADGNYISEWTGVAWLNALGPMDNSVRDLLVGSSVIISP